MFYGQTHETTSEIIHGGNYRDSYLARTAHFLVLFTELVNNNNKNRDNQKNLKNIPISRSKQKGIIRIK